MHQKFEVSSFAAFRQQYYNNLDDQSCLIPCLEELCGGWTQETLKSIIQKLTKKNQAPMPLFFDSSNAMDAISNKKQALAHTFQAFDSRGIGRIDATEVFAVMLLLSKGELSQIFYSKGLFYLDIAVIYGSDRTVYITQDELFFFFDSLFRGLAKVLVCKGETKPVQVNKRLSDADITKFILQIFKGQNQLRKEELFQATAQVTPLYEFIYYVYQHLQGSMEYSREETLKMMKINLEVKKVMAYLLMEVEKGLKK